MRPIVITGGPGAGKTSIIEQLAQQGCVTFAESSRNVIEQQLVVPNGILPWTDLPAFANLCLALMQQQKQQANQQAGFCFVDRAIPDIVAYLQLGGCQVSSSILSACQGYHRQVFSCQPEPSIYVQDDVRPHSFDEAMQVHVLINKIYTQLGYQVVDVPWGSIEQRVLFIQQQLRA